MGEGMRFRNKLTYDLMKKIPQMLSLRTQFVHLYVKDNTDGTSDSFADYGLYTQVEQLNKTGMKLMDWTRMDSCTKLILLNSIAMRT